MKGKAFVGISIALLLSLIPLAAAADGNWSLLEEAELVFVGPDSAGADREDMTVVQMPKSPEAALMARLRSLPSVGSMAWPIVREYIWETCFEENELFVGYVDSYPGREDGSAVVFHLMIDKDVWTQMAPDQRRAELDQGKKLLEGRLKAVDLRGTLEVMLVAR